MTSRPSRAVRATILFFILVGLFGLVCYRALEPSIPSVTMDELKAVVPAELLLPLPVDPTAVQRFKDVGAIAVNFDEKSLKDFEDTRVSEVERRAIAHRLLSSHVERLNQLENLIKGGKVQVVHSDDDTIDTSYKYGLRRLEKLLRAEADYYFRLEKFDEGVRCLRIALMLGDRITESDGLLFDYLTGTIFEEIALKGVQEMGSAPKTPEHALLELLRAVKPAKTEDLALVAALKTNFQKYTLKALVTPVRTIELEAAFGSDTGKGSRIWGDYRPIETAKFAASYTLAEMKRAGRTMAEYDHSNLSEDERFSSSIPEEPDTDRPDSFAKSVDNLKYRIAMNTTRNSLGKKLCMIVLGSAHAEMDISVRLRVNRDLTRVLLASQIYRLRHDGKPASSTQDLVPILGSWPNDPYNGKPMIYRPDKGVAYSVGRNQVDDGGDIDRGVFNSLDCGIHLLKDTSISEEDHDGPPRKSPVR